eukprot:1456114-Heterocapsa_arctica.AAC.1
MAGSRRCRALGSIRISLAMPRPRILESWGVAPSSGDRRWQIAAYCCESAYDDSVCCPSRSF